MMTSVPDPLRWIDTCDAEVNSHGEARPCEKVAVAMAQGDGDDGQPWAVCKGHARGRTLVPLAQIVAWARDDQRQRISDNRSRGALLARALDSHPSPSHPMNCPVCGNGEEGECICAIAEAIAKVDWEAGGRAAREAPWERVSDLKRLHLKIKALPEAHEFMASHTEDQCRPELCGGSRNDPCGNRRARNEGSHDAD